MSFGSQENCISQQPLFSPTSSRALSPDLPASPASYANYLSGGPASTAKQMKPSGEVNKKDLREETSVDHGYESCDVESEIS